MSKINNMEALRDFALDTLEKLAAGEIDTHQAGVTGKICETVISTVKAQLEFARMIQEEPNIPFMQNAHGTRTLEGRKENLALPGKK